MPVRGWIGIRFTAEAGPAPSVRQGSLQLLVSDVYPNSPADLTGIVPGDWFVSFDGRPLTTHETWLRSTSNLHAGQSVRLVLVRNGDQREVTVVADPAPAFVLPNPLDEMELATARFDSVFEDFLRLPRGAERPWHTLPGITFRGGFGVDAATVTVMFGDPDGDVSAPPGGAVLFGGVLVRDLTKEMGSSYFGVEKGVLVTDVFPMSPGRQAGFRAGDVIVSAEGRAFENVRDFRRLLVELSTPIELAVVRRKESVKIVFPRPPG